jgi:hypothetical protein
MCTPSLLTSAFPSTASASLPSPSSSPQDTLRSRTDLARLDFCAGTLSFTSHSNPSCTSPSLSSPLPLTNRASCCPPKPAAALPVPLTVPSDTAADAVAVSPYAATSSAPSVTVVGAAAPLRPLLPFLCERCGRRSCCCWPFCSFLAARVCASGTKQSRLVHDQAAGPSVRFWQPG